MRLRGIYLFFGAALVALALTGCSWEPQEPPVAPPAERVFLMYDNITDPYFNDDVREAGKAVGEGALSSGDRVVVFHRNYHVTDVGSRSVVYELVADSSQPERFRREMLKVYDQGVNAELSTGVIAGVVGDIRRALPAPHYALAFGSHGKGWIPKSNTTPISRRGGVPDGIDRKSVV
jgi:hypothetical protein